MSNMSGIYDTPQLTGETERSLKKLDQKTQVSTDAAGSTKQISGRINLKIYSI
jgi:hypothetical protein|tara:strand:- start:419 stop:577 length:159 start_codon:yes stop_codon:yes gene_type:complete